MAPNELGGKVIAETPATDPDNLVGRVVNIPVSDLTGNQKKYHMRVRLKITSVKGKSAETVFDGFECLREYLSRFVRNGSKKIENVLTAKTADSWEIKVKILSVSFRIADTNVQKKLRKTISEYIAKVVAKSKMYNFVNAVIANRPQLDSMKLANKIHPVRFNEVAKIEVLNRGK